METHHAQVSEYITVADHHTAGSACGSEATFRRIIVGTISHIHTLAAGQESEVEPPKYIKDSDRVYHISDEIKFAANYVTAIRGLRAIQILRNRFRDKVDSGYARRAAIGILVYSTRPDSPMNESMESEVLALDVSRERWYK